MADQRICVVDGCDKRHAALGFCNSHLARWKRHGDPLAGGPSRSLERGRCSVAECDLPEAAKGFCNKHYARWRRNGDPLGGGASPGDLVRWIEARKGYAGDDCLSWPFGVGAGGYGLLNVDGVTQSASHFMCRTAHGDPAEGYEAAHSCGNRICCNPRHLRWDTRSGNLADKVQHGTDNRGEKNPTVKLTEEEVRQIRMIRGQRSQKEIGALFGVHASTVCRIQTGEDWHWMV